MGDAVRLLLDGLGRVRTRIAVDVTMPYCALGQGGLMVGRRSALPLSSRRSTQPTKRHMVRAPKHIYCLLPTTKLNACLSVCNFSVLQMDSHDQNAKIPTSAPAGSSVHITKTPSDTSSLEIIKSFEGFLSFVLSLSIFGASTFAIIVSEIANPNELSLNPRFTRETVRTLLGIAWLFFVLALGIVAASMSLLAYQREHSIVGFEGLWRQRWERLGLVASSLIQVLVITAFLFLSLVLVAYTEAVGWVAVALTSTAAAFAFLSLAVQWV